MLTAGVWTLFCTFLGILLLGVILWKLSWFSQISDIARYAMRVMAGIAAALVLNNAVLFCVAASIRMHMRHMVVEGELPPYHVGLYYLLLLGGRIWGRFRAELRWLLVPSRTGASVEAVAV